MFQHVMTVVDEFMCNKCLDRYDFVWMVTIESFVVWWNCFNCFGAWNRYDIIVYNDACVEGVMYCL